MSSTRNKRKRAEADSRSVGRPKSREQRDAAPPSEKKNEGTKVTVARTRKEVNFSAVERQDQTITKDASLKTRSVTVGDGSVATADNHTSRQKGSLSPNNSTSSKPLHSREVSSSSDRSNSALGQESSRSERLQGLIAHRSSLRNRIRFCAAAAKERLREEVGESNDLNLDIRKLKSGDDNEISLFMEMTSSATIAAKRIRSETEANSDRRSSLSLRRGSSVGKRMNAALSSLAPGSSTTSHSPSNLSSIESNTKVALNEKEKQTVGSTQVHKTQLRSNLTVPQTQPLPSAQAQSKSSDNANDTTISILPQRRQSKQDKPSIFVKSQDLKNMDGKSPTTTRNSKYSDLQLASNRQSSSTDSNRMASPMHLKVVAESLPHNKLSGRNVFSSKSTILRKQRDAIEASLNTYREQTRQKVLGVPARNSSFQHRSLHRRKTVSLPQRKTTHWDALLQEMSWMATDFIEERKWKESASRSISSAVVSPSENLSSATRLAGEENTIRVNATSEDKSRPSTHKNTHRRVGSEKKRESVSSFTKLKEMSMKTYPASVLEGDGATRKIGRNIALMITKLGSAVMDAIEMQEVRQKEDQQIVRNQRGILRRKEKVSPMSPRNGNSVSRVLNGQKHFSFPEISGQIAFLEKLKEQRNRGVSRSDASKSASLSKSRLSRAQKDTIDRIMNLWNLPNAPGIVLNGTHFCGKTHTVSFLMWQRRKQGPQILLCPIDSMTKWKHEIERLGDVRVLSYGLPGTLSYHVLEGRVVLPDAGDIVLCEFELLDHVAGFFESSTNSLKTIAVDCRSPAFFYSSVGKSTQSLDGKNSPRSFDFSSELLSIPWWDKLLDQSLSSNAAILLIEQTDGSHFLQNHSNLSPRIKLEIAASRAALLIGPRFFVSGNETIQRRVLSWARNHAKLEGKRKSTEAREALEKATMSLIISLPSSELPNEKIHWELRRCKMEGFQRSNYDDCCIQVRGALSCRLSELVERSHDSLHSVSASLMLLREQCVHSDTRGERRNSRMPIPTRVAESPAQSDSAFAMSLIEGSAKLREMISILRSKCGVNVPEYLTTACNVTEQSMEVSIDQPRKVVILATLPIVRKTVSLLLTALGIQHKHSAFLQGLQSVASSQATASVFSPKCQQFLPCFDNTRSHGSTSQPSADIVVASPMCLASWNDGRGVDNADTVILLDEDWTGRGEFILSVLMSRIQANSSHARKSCEFIRLICDNTIEEKLFSSSTGMHSFAESTQWPRDRSGFVTFPETESEAAQLYKATTREANKFPLLRVTKLRHELLSSTLLPSRTIPLEVRSASKILFLPFAQNDGRNDNGEITSEVELIRVLCHEESVASQCIVEPNAGDCSAESSNKVLLLRTSHTAGVFRPLFTTRQKFCVISYLQNLFASNIEHFESSFAQGSKNNQSMSSDQHRPAAAILAPHYSAGEKPIPSSKTPLNSSPSANQRTSDTSILHYAPPKQRGLQHGRSRKESTKQEMGRESNEASRRSNGLHHRLNCYSNLFATVLSLSEKHAGYEGIEPLLFFPPFVNGERQMGAFKTCQTSTIERNKRKVGAAPAVDLPNSKRARQIEVSPSIISKQPDDSKATSNAAVASTNSSTDAQRRTITQQHASSLPKQLAPSGVSHGHIRRSDESVVTGIPRRPSDVHTIHQKIGVSREFRVYPFLDISEVPEHILQPSSGRSNSFLDSVVLFVKRPGIQNKGSTGVTGFDPNAAKYSADIQLSALSPLGVEKFIRKGGQDEEKRQQKKVNGKIPQTYLAQPPSAHGSHAGQATTSQATDTLKKLGHRHRLHDFFIARSLSSGLSMFECVPYQAVAAQIEARVSSELEKRELFLGSERGIFTLHQQLESDAAKTQNAHRRNTGRKILGVSSTLAQKCEIPMLFSIGPRGGFLSSFKGINSPSAQRRQLGVSLPMGVKVLKARGEAQQTTWSQNANLLLCDMVKRYGQNWILIAKMMQQILREEKRKNLFYRTSEILWCKSAERCQSHWEKICEISESKTPKMDVAFCERRVMSIRTDGERHELHGKACLSMLGLRESPVLVGRKSMMTASDLPKNENEFGQAYEGQTPSDGDQKTPQRNANQFFSSLITSNVQRRMMPIAIIGVGNGPKANQTAHSHPSHLQSVQDSVTSHWSDGRAELWPLQILDAAEKQYVAARVPSVPPKPSSHPHVSSSTSALPPRGHGHPYPRVPANPPTSTHSATKAAPPLRMSGPNNVGVLPPHANIAPKKTTPHNGLARNSGKSNARSK